MDWESLLAQLPVLTAVVHAIEVYSDAAAVLWVSKRLLSTGANSGEIRATMWHLRTASFDWGDGDDPADKTPLQRYVIAFEAAARYGDLRAVRHMAETSPDTLRQPRPPCSCLPPTGIAIATNAACMAIVGYHLAILQYLVKAVQEVCQLEMIMSTAISTGKPSSVDVLLEAGATFGPEYAKFALNFTKSVEMMSHLCTRRPDAFRDLLCYAVEACQSLSVVQLLCESVGCKTTTRVVHAAHHVNRQDLFEYLQNRLIIENAPLFRGWGRHYPPRR